MGREQLGQQAGVVADHREGVIEPRISIAIGGDGGDDAELARRVGDLDGYGLAQRRRRLRGAGDHLRALQAREVEGLARGDEGDVGAGELLAERQVRRDLTTFERQGRPHLVGDDDDVVLPR